MTKDFDTDQDHAFLTALLKQWIRPGHRNRYRNEEVEPLSGANMANLCGIYSICLKGDQCDPLESTIKNELTGILKKALGTLSPRHQKVLILRFGLFGGNEHTLGDVGKLLGVTRERVRQIEMRALRELRRPTRSRQLKSFHEAT